MEEIFSCVSLTYSIGYKKIFKNLNFSLYQNEFSILTGENGSGKSTLLKLISHFSKHKEFKAYPFDKKRPFLSYLGHENGLYSSLSLKENLEFFNGVLPSKRNPEEINFLLKSFNLEKRLEDPVHTFSEGMKKKSGIIRALLPASEILLMDEPLNGLDSKSKDAFLEILKQIKSTTTIVLVSHETESISKIAGRKLVIKSGAIIND